MKKISILVADDHMIVRIGLVALLSSEPDLHVVAEADDGKDAIAKTLKHRPDIVVMDLMMPGMDGVAATAEIKAKCPASKVILLTSYSTSDGISHALDAGADGAVLKTADDTMLLTAIRKVAQGETYVSPSIRKMLAANPPLPELTDRQLDVLEAMSRGLTNRDIATELGICEARVAEHVNNILSKLEAANRAEAVGIALRKHLLKA